MVYAFGRGSEAGQTTGTVASDIFSFPPSMEKYTILQVYVINTRKSLLK